MGCNLGRFGVAVYGRAEKLKQIQVNSSSQDDNPVTCIFWVDSKPAEWIQRDVGDRAKIVYTHSVIAMIDMTRDGFGISQFYYVLGDSYPKL